MKMRKILSFVLVLSLVLGSFSMAFAATPSTGLSDIAGIANEDAVQVNADLGIITGFPDGTFLPEKTVTRAEFAAMITRALAVPESALAGYTSTTFKDTAGYGWAVPYLAFAQSKGIMIGDGLGNAMPGRTINVNEAMTMVLRALGYVNHSAELVGTWPSNYVTVAQNVGLYDDVAAAVTVDRANAAQIIYNALTVQKVSVNADGETKYLTVNNTTTAATLLNTGLGAEAQTAAVITGEEDSTINLKPYVGAYAVTYVKDNEVVAVGDVKSEFITGKYTSSSGIIKMDGVEYKLANTATVGAVGYIFDNGDASSIATTTAIGTFDGQTVKIAVDKTGKTVNKLYSIATWTVDDARVVDKADLEGIKDNELLAFDFAENDDDEIDMKSFELVGANSLEDIKVDNVVYVYANNTPEIAKVAVGTKIVEGKVTEKDGAKYVVGGTKYEAAPNALAKNTNPAVGAEVKLYLDFEGKVFDWESTAATADKYAVAKFYQSAAIDDAKIKLYTTEDSTKTFNIDDDADVTGTPMAVNTEAAVLVGYALDKDGKIEALDFAATKVSSAAVVTLQSVSVINIDGQTKVVAKDAVVFTNATTAAVGDLDLTTIDKVANDENLNGLNVFQYITNTKGEIVAMVIDADAASKTDTEAYGVFHKVTDALNSSDDTVQRLQGYVDGTAFDKQTTKSNTFTGVITTVALYTVEFDADGMVKVTTPVTATAAGTTIAAINDARTAVQAITTGGAWYALASDVVVYEVTDRDTSDIEYRVTSVNSLRAANNYIMWLYDTDKDNAGYEVIIFAK